MTTADSVKAKIQGLIQSANAKTGSNDVDLTAAVNALIAGFGQGGDASSFEVTEGTITPTTTTQTLRIPWSKETLPLFYVVMRQDFDTYVTPDNPATGTVVGGIVQFDSGYIRMSATTTSRYAGIKLTATTGYAGYTGSSASASNDILTADGLKAETNTSMYKWRDDVTYKYYIVDKVVQ